ncbi:MAG TPA: ABC transporter substrate-binding protein [Candidatus Eisenbacteria bacterium]|nr:ABC transporter substrate-binding protein [Candidatus Eisenbacteria bacterium]
MKRILVGLVIMLVLSAGTAAPAGEPLDQLRQTIDTLLQTLTNPELKGNAHAKERRQKLREIIYPRFDFSEMAKRALGSHWQKRTPEEQQEFTRLFTALLEEAYLDTIESYKGEKIQYLNERQDRAFAQVDTKIIDQKGQEYSVNYRLHKAGGEWKVYDVVVENISLVNNYRSQFNRILGRSSYEQLIAAMREKKFSAPTGKS